MQNRTASPRTRKASTKVAKGLPTDVSVGAPKVAKLHRHDDGRVHALSSNGVTRYAIRNAADGTWTCTCPGYTHHGHCYHAATAMQRFPGFFKPAAVIVPATDPDPEPPTPAAPAVIPFPICTCDATCDTPDPVCPFHGRPAGGYVFNPVLGQWLFNPILARASALAAA